MGKLTTSLLLITFFATYGQKCNCDITLHGLSDKTANVVWANQFDYTAGDTICIPAGTYRGIRFYDLKGSANNPITIKNCGGKVIIDEPQYSGIDLQRSSFIHITGTGDPNMLYGFKIINTGSGAVGVNLQNLSTDIEIDHIEVSYAGFAGVMAKTDPKCSRPDTWRRNGFVMRNLDIHHNFIHNTGGEGIYIGFTGGYKLNSNRSCSGDPIYGHWLENVDVHHNILKAIDWDGIQLNLVRENGIVRDNIVTDYGTDGQWAQAHALSVGGGTYCIYNNYFDNNNLQKGWGIQLISAQSGTKVFNNVIVKPKKHGIFLHQRHDFENPSEGYYIVNNTIIEPERSGVHYNAKIIHPNDFNDTFRKQDEVPNYFVNNLIVDPGFDFVGGNTWKQDQESYIDFNDRSTRDSMAIHMNTNLLPRDIDTLGLKDVFNNDYRPACNTSAVVNCGTDVTSWDITFDLNNNFRPSGSGHDIGAFEFVEFSGNSLKSNLPSTPSSRTNPKLIDTALCYPNPDSTFVRIEHPLLSKATIGLYTVEGKPIFTSDYVIEDGLNISKYKAGIYFLQLTATEFSKTHQFIIK